MPPSLDEGRAEDDQGAQAPRERNTPKYGICISLNPTSTLSARVANSSSRLRLACLKYDYWVSEALVGERAYVSYWNLLLR